MPKYAKFTFILVLLPAIMQIPITNRRRALSFSPGMDCKHHDTCSQKKPNLDPNYKLHTTSLSLSQALRLCFIGTIVFYPNASDALVNPLSCVSKHHGSHSQSCSQQCISSPKNIFSFFKTTRKQLLLPSQSLKNQWKREYCMHKLFHIQIIRSRH